MKYIALMYDQKSDLNKIEDLEERKRAACKKAGLEYNEKTVQEIVHLKNEEVNELIDYYHIQNNSNKYRFLCSQQQLFNYAQRIISDPINTTDQEEIQKEMKMRTSLSNECDAILDRIDKLYPEIYVTTDVIEMAENNLKKILTAEQRLKINGVSIYN